VRRIDDVDFLEFAAAQESKFFVGLSEDREGILQRFESGVMSTGDTLPWLKTHESFRMRPGEVTLWAGINGHGKSLVLSHVTVHLLQHTTVALASMEMSIQATGHRLLRQMLGTSRPTQEIINASIDWTDDNRLWVYDQLDTVASERILGMAIYAMRELKCAHVIIDSLMKCGIGPDDYEGQQKFVDRLCWAAKTYGGHISLVHHVRKGQDEDQAPGKFDVKGAGGITDLVDNIVIVHRRKSKERKVEKGEEVDRLEPDTVLRIEKQRHGEWEGAVNLYFHGDSHQYLSGPDARPRLYGPAAERVSGH
jgi:twinkle protein